MDERKQDTNMTGTLDVGILKEHIGSQVQMTVSYKTCTCVGNLEEGEEYRNHEKPQKTFNYRLLDVLVSNKPDPESRKYVFIRSSDEGKDVLIPFAYETTPCLSLRRFCETSINTLESITLANGSKIVPENSRIYKFNDGARHVIANDDYTEADAERLQGTTLEKYGCSYNSEKHIITGDIGRFVDGFFRNVNK